MSKHTNNPRPVAQAESAQLHFKSRWAWLFEPVDIAGIVFFRIVFAAVVLGRVWMYFQKGWIRLFYIDPPFHPDFYGFGWIKPWPGDGMYIHFAVLGIAAAMVLVGLWYRVAIVIVWLAFTQQSLIDRTLFQNHDYLMCLVSFLMIFIPAHRAFSVDALFTPRLRSDFAPGWTLWLLRFQIGVPYFFGGIAKLNSDWLRGWPLRIWLSQRTDFPVIGRYFTEEWCVYFFTYAGLIFDLAAEPFLLWRKSRVPAFLAVLVFNGINSQLFEIDVFPWMMIGATTIFFSSSWPRTVIHKLLRIPSKIPARLSTPFHAVSGQQKILIVFLGVYSAVQLLVPLRHFLYPGNVRWTNEGYSFAWLMKSRNQVVAIRFHATDKKTGQTGIVDLGHYLTMHQIPRIGGDLDMVLDFKDYLREEFLKQGHDEVEIRALILASLNGRAPQLMIDPEVDLVPQRRTLLHHALILPLTQPLRETAWNIPLTQWEQHPEVKTRLERWR